MHRFQYNVLNIESKHGIPLGNGQFTQTRKDTNIGFDFMQNIFKSLQKLI